MAESLKKQTLRGVSWSAIERFSVQGINFLLQIILARLLLPSDYGLIGMLAIFIQLAQVFIDSGFANALIQKQNCEEKDYSTVFFYNLGLSLFIYVIFFISAPYIANFYKEPLLTQIMRVISITLVLNALSIVQKTKLVKAVDFKTQTKVSVCGAIISGIVGIISAYGGLGVWALCIQQILNSLIQLFLLTFYVRWYPSTLFDKDSFNGMFSFGSRLLMASIIGVVYRNLYTIVIGKKFSAISLGYYTRAEHFVMFPSNNLANVIARVVYPVFSKIQNDDAKLKSAYSLVIKGSSFIIFPLMAGLLAITKPFISVVLTDKWMGIVPLMQILCLDWMLDHITTINLNLLYVKGRSDLALRLEIIKKTVAVIILFSSIPFGLIGMCWGRVIYSIFATVINTYYTNRLLNYSFLRQLKDFYPYLLASFVMAIVVLSCLPFLGNSISQLFIGILIGICVYAIIAMTCFRSLINQILEMFQSLKK